MTAAQQPTERNGNGRRRLVVAGAGVLAGVAVGLAAVYGIGTFLGNPAADGGCEPALKAAKRAAPFARGEVAAVTVADKPLRIPDLAFHDDSGAQKTLADWSGRTVLLNLWATWCVPCRKEMPALDALQAELGGASFEVVAVNIDTREPEKPRNWLREVGIRRLGYYADPSAKVFQDLKLIGLAFGMPTTLLVDPARCEIGAIAGPAEWASDDGVKLIKAALGE
ncbi:MAG TPA: TlpA disulfide reductase family protein [Xanthobacteraceae bacterium]|jgi:thiol-disulfide isomerase/thioredoxin